MSFRRRALGAFLWLVACSDPSAPKLDGLGLADEARAALSRVRFSPLRSGDRVVVGDLILCGRADRVLLAFSRRLMNDYLGIDANFVVPELFPLRAENELYLEVPESHLMRLRIPPGIGTTAPHPEARVREFSGSPRWSGDLRAIARLFDEGQIFAHALPAKLASPKAATGPRRIGISPFPRMGPRSGVVIERVLADGAAERAGLRTGDKIVAVNGQKVGDIYAMKTAVQNSRGREAVLSVKRAGSSTTVTVTVSF